MDEPLVAKRSGRSDVVTGELSVIDVGNGVKVEVHGGVDGHEREHDRNVGHETPLDSGLSTIVGTE